MKSIIINGRNFILVLAVITLALLALAAGSRALAKPDSGPNPGIISYQGYLTNSSGAPLDGSYAMQFDLYEAPSGGSWLWSESYGAVQVENGYFNVMLGSLIPFTQDDFDGSERYLEVQVDLGSGLINMGRQQLATVPYAIQAVNTEFLDGKPSSDYQPRLEEDCAVGSSIRGIDFDGRVTCWRDGPFSRSAPRQDNMVRLLDGLGDTGYHSSITIGSDGLGIMAYYQDADFSNPVDNLVVAHCEDLECTRVVSHTIATAEGMIFPRIAIGKDGNPMVAYHTGSGPYIFSMADCQDTECSTFNNYSLFNTSSIQQGLSFSIGSDGLGLIALSDYANKSVKALHCDNEACSSATAQTVVQKYAAGVNMVIGADGLPLLTYGDISTDTAIAAHCTDVSCTSVVTHTLPTSSGDAGSGPLVIGEDGLPLITFGATDRLVAIHCDDVECGSSTLNTISLPHGPGMGMALTIGADGLPVAAFSIGNGLHVLHCSNYACTNATGAHVPGTGSGMAAPEMTIGVDGFPLIMYYDGLILYQVHCGSPFCVPYWQRQ